MDGGRRVLRSLTEQLGSPFAFAFARPQLAAGAVSRPLPRARGPRRSRLEKLRAAAIHPLATGALIFGFLGGAFAYAAVRGGAYENFIQTVGTPGDSTGSRREVSMAMMRTLPSRACAFRASVVAVNCICTWPDSSAWAVSATPL